eukprot:1734169-Lingulodinium_polyedra.AAC.1
MRIVGLAATSCSKHAARRGAQLREQLAAPDAANGREPVGRKGCDPGSGGLRLGWPWRTRLSRPLTDLHTAKNFMNLKRFSVSQTMQQGNQTLKL